MRYIYLHKPEPHNQSHHITEVVIKSVYMVFVARYVGICAVYIFVIEMGRYRYT